MLGVRRYIISNKGGMLHPNSKVEVVGRSGPLLTVDSGGFESGKHSRWLWHGAGASGFMGFVKYGLGY